MSNEINNEEDYYMAPDGTIWPSKADYDAYRGYSEPPLEGSLGDEMNMSHPSTDSSDNSLFMAPNGMLYNDKDMYVMCMFITAFPENKVENTIWVKGEYLITPDKQIFSDAAEAEAHMAQIFPGIKYSIKEITIDEIKALQEYYDTVDPELEPLMEISREILKGLCDVLQEQPPIK